MSIIAANVKLYKSQEMNDNPTGGGVMTNIEVADGVSGDVFPSISRLDKSGGKLNLRKLFGKIDSDNSDLYGGAHAVLSSRSTDTDVSELVIRSEAFERADLIADMEGHFGRSSTFIGRLSGNYYAGDTVLGVVDASAYTADKPYYLYRPEGEYNPAAYGEIIWIISIDTVADTITVATPLKADYTLYSNYAVYCMIYEVTRALTGRGYGIVGLSSAAASGQKTVALDTINIRVLPENTAAASDIDYSKYPGLHPAFMVNDAVLIIEGATEEEATISSISGTTITLVDNLTNSFTSAAIMDSICPRGDLQAAKGIDFTQETWDGSTFSDTQSGGPASGTYSFAGYPLSVNNHDAITDRIGLDFTSSTAFNIISEKYGNLGTGTTSAAVAPTNPLTGDPYFTLSASGWGGTWQAGNVLRFNVIGAMAEIWLARCINTGASGTGSDGTDIEFRGDVAS